MKILLFDRDLLEARPLSRFRPIFAYRDGIFTPLERVRREVPDAELYYYHPDETHERAMAARENLTPFRVAFPNAKPDRSELEARFDRILDSRDLSPFDLLDRVGERIRGDLALTQDFARKPPGELPPGCQLVGRAEELHLHVDATLLPGVVFDCSAGPVVVEAGARVSPFSYLAGPLYVGPGARIDDARLGGGTILGREVRAGGEIENSIFGDFTNKHHEGFVGHSLLGSWVNLGALSTTSDLKNNYGLIRLEIPLDLYPGIGSPRQEVESHRIKFGSILGDCVKTAIGTMLNTGTVVDAGSNVFGGSPARYLPPLAWGVDAALYEPDRFLADCSKIFARRQQSPHPSMHELVARLVEGRRRARRERGFNRRTSPL